MRRSLTFRLALCVVEIEGGSLMGSTSEHGPLCLDDFGRIERSYNASL